MIYKLGLMGASGRMGQEVASLLSTGFSLGSDAFELSDGITRSGRLVSLEGMSLRTMDEPAREPVHAWIDFSRPEGTLRLLEAIDCPIVIGTTGFSGAEMEHIHQYAKRAPVLLCSNTSIGMKVMGEMVRRASPLAGLGFAPVLAEDHHRHKKDSPSGTAKRLLEILRESGFGEPQVQVTRAGSIVGNHTVRFIADGEELSIEHRVTDRKVFAKGALLGVHFLLQRKTPRVYYFDEISMEEDGK